MKKKDDFSDEQDPVWNLLDQASSHEASPRFTDDVLRAARLADQEKFHFSWPIFATFGASFAALTVAGVVLFSAEKPQSQIAAAPQMEDVSEEAFASLDEQLGAELLSLAADSPSLFSDEEIIDLLF